MTERHFGELLAARWAAGQFVCVGLDSAIAKLPRFASAPIGSKGPQDAFNRHIIGATHEEVCAYKPNTAFYEARGVAGVRDLRSTMQYLGSHAPDVPVIIDAKRADIGNTNDGYVEFVFDYLGADAVTVHPFLGQEALKPFLDRADKGIIVLCRTSNPGAGEFQARLVQPTPDEAERWGITTEAIPFYQLVAYRVSREWNTHGNCALVVGATAPEELSVVRSIVGDTPILIPGVGAQGGDLEEAVIRGKNSNNAGIAINASRSVIFASDGPDFTEAAVAEVRRMNTTIRRALAA